MSSGKKGWVIEEKGSGYVGHDFGGCHPLHEAKVFTTRAEARVSHMKTGGDVVRRVALDDKGYASEVLRRHA